MSSSQSYEEITVSSDGVTVVKRFEEDEFPVPAIAFEFQSERDEQVTVRLSDEVPDGVEVEDLGFHPEYGSEFWTIDESQITFEKELGANSEYTTVYGIRATGADDVEQFLTTPVFEEVNPPLPDSGTDDAGGSEDIVPESDDDVVKDVIAGDGEVPGLEDEDDDTEEEEIDTLDLKDPNAEGGEQTADGDEETTDEVTEVSMENGSIVREMANEIRQQEVSIEDLKLVQRAIDELSSRNGASSDDSGSDGATDARIQRLQSDIADLRAYTDALEGFLEENGTARQMISDFEEQLDSFSADLDEMQSEISETSETVDNEIESVHSRINSVSGDVDDVQGEVDSVWSEINDVEGDVEGVQGEVDEVRGDVGSVDARVSELESSLDDVQSAVESLEQEVTEGDVAQEIEDINQEIENLKEWQSQIKSTFGG